MDIHVLINHKSKDPLGQLVNANNIFDEGVRHLKNGFDITELMTGYPNHLVTVKRILAGVVKGKQN